MYIYLAGPISNLTYEESSGWRERAERLMPNWMSPLNPLLVTDKKFAEEAGGKFGDGKSDPLSHSDAFFNRDMYWVDKADVVIANFSIIPEGGIAGGTVFELGAAYQAGKIILLVGPQKNIPLFCLKSAHVRFETVDEAIEYLEITYGAFKENVVYKGL